MPNDRHRSQTQRHREDRLDRPTDSDIEVKPVYTAADAPERDLEPPGEYPYTRGIYPTMYRGRRWTMRQYAGFSTAEESNRRYRTLLERGQTGLSVALDLPTQLGMDSDDPRAVGEVGGSASRSRPSTTCGPSSTGSIRRRSPPR
jgi:methylmalonyl-CoA mutase N-terminal domain/subunit